MVSERWAAMFRKMTYLFSHQAEALNLIFKLGIKVDKCKVVKLKQRLLSLFKQVKT